MLDTNWTRLPTFLWIAVVVFCHQIVGKPTTTTTSSIENLNHHHHDLHQQTQQPNNLTNSTTNTTATTDDDDDSLLLVQILFRHGDRTPISLYANDPYRNYSWNDGLGMLTLCGKRRIYQYGQVLRRRYANYVASENLFNKNIHAQSSPRKRCLESSLALLAGLVPPTSAEQIWSDNNDSSSSSSSLGTTWQPIAVSSTDEQHSWLLNPDAPCARAEAADTRLPGRNLELSKFLQENQQFIQQVARYTGQNFTRWYQVSYVYDTIMTERHFFGAANYSMPEWLTKIGNNTLERLGRFNAFLFSAYGQDREYIRLRTGLLIGELIENMRQVGKDTSETFLNRKLNRNTRKLYTYATHDTLIAYLLHAFGLYRGDIGKQPTYGSGLILELRSNREDNNLGNGTGTVIVVGNPSNVTSIATTTAGATKDDKSTQPPQQQLQVHLFYANVTDNYNIFRLNFNSSEKFMTNCQFAYCSLDGFVRSLTDLVVNDIVTECKI